jgi:hypothetical protein
VLQVEIQREGVRLADVSREKRIHVG